MRDALTQEDPYFSPNLTYSRISRCNLERITNENREILIEERKKFYTK
jgi:hypothetical protein